MSYIGNTPTQQNFVAGADQFSGNGSTVAFTLSRSVNTVFDIFVTVSNVPQDPFTAYTVSGNTLTFDSAPPSGTNNIDVVYRATNVQTFVPTPGVSTQLGLGSASAPSLTFIGDTNTGIFSPAADTIAFTEGGVESMRIDSNRNVLVGTTSASIPSTTGFISTANTFGFKNRIINGNFAVAQRGTSFTSTSSANNDDTYNLDRWYVLSDGNDIVDITQNTAASDTGDKYNIALDVETVNKKFGIAQIIENINCADLQGQSVTLSFKAKVSATTKLDNVKCAIVAWSGTADTVTSDIVSAWNVEGTNPTLIANATYENTPANLNVTTSWAAYSVTATVDTSSTGNVIVFIWSDVTDTTLGDFLYITNVQLEKGSTATSFDYRDYGRELILCQRYLPAFNSTGTVSVIGGGYASATNSVNLVVPFLTQTRVAPTGVSVSSASHISWSSTATNTVSAVSFNAASNTEGVVTLTATATSGQGGVAFFNNTSGQLLFNGCEL